MSDIFIRYAHFLGIMILSSCLFAEYLLISREVALKQFKKIMVIDAIFGMSALMILIAGLLLWFYVGVSEYYTTNWIFHLKLTLFVLIALLSIYPTVFFLRNRTRQDDSITIPKAVITLIRLEMLLLFMVPLCAVFMARGYG